jgi:hypothetical protein
VRPRPSAARVDRRMSLPSRPPRGATSTRRQALPDMGSLRIHVTAHPIFPDIARLIISPPCPFALGPGFRPPFLHLLLGCLSRLRNPLLEALIVDQLLT